MAQKITNTGKALIGIAIVGAIFCAKIFWWDKRPHEVQASQTFGKVAIPDAPEASLTGNSAVKLELPSTSVAANGGTQVTWYQMAWQSQNNIIYSNGGKQTTKGSLFDKYGLDVTIVRQDDCAQSCAELVKFCQAYKNDPKTPGVFITFMGSGIAAYINGMMNTTKDLGPEYQPIAWLTTGKSYGEDQLIGDVKFKNNKQLLKGATCMGYRMDGDQDLALKLSNDNNVKVNADETLYDPDALNLMYCKDFLDAVVKYNSGYTETRKFVKDGKTTGRDTTIGVDIVATWTPGDVNAHNGRGGVTIISTKEWASVMPNITITCKKWLNDHRTDAENITAACAIAGDQIRSFNDVKKYTCGLVAEVYNEQSGDYWYRYYNGVQVDENTHLGGSMVFNLADMANMLGLGESRSDIYRSIYTTFGNLQSKYYPKDLPKVPEYSTAFDKSILMSVISNHPELLEGKANLPDYNSIVAKVDNEGNITNAIGNKRYNSLEFATGSAEILPSSEETLDQIYNDATTADGTKLVVSGHTDNTGNPSANQTLSEARAQAVINYLRKKGLPADRFSKPVGYGDSKPVATNATAEGKRKNRRVEVLSLSN